jgi:GNAT superfamily N-acetyltransferase
MTTVLAPADSSVAVIHEVSGWRARNAFVRMPWPIYADDPQWVPPLLLERREFIHPRKQPFLQHGSAAMFLARRDGQNVGRILVSDDPHYNAEHSTNLGCFGMFESIDDVGVAHALLNAAADWLRARGRSEVMGPIDYSTNYSCGLLVDGFDTPPRVMMNHNPPYYAALLESWGLKKAKDLMAWWFVVDDHLIDKWGRIAKRVLERQSVKIRHFQKSDAKNEIRRCKEIYDGAWQRNWGFVRMTDAEFFHFAEGLLQLVPPELLLLAEVDGQAVGLSLTLPDFNEAVRSLDGMLFPWGLPTGLMKFKRNCRKIETGRVLIMGVLEQYRRRGITEAIIVNTIENVRKFGGYKHCELSWTLEDNVSVNRALESSGAKVYKTYRIYNKSLLPAR